MAKIRGFFTSDSPFSQWYPAKFTVNGIEYSCAEQFMMAEKARLFDPTVVPKIMASNSPREQKRLGRIVQNYNEQVWQTNRFNIVCQGSYAKFSQNDDLKSILLATGDDILVEASPYDKIWGVGLPIKHPDLQDPTKWKGLNLLGQALMDARTKIAKEN